MAKTRIIKVGSKAPVFKLPGSDGITHSLKDYKGQKVVLFFYPKDLTSGCTKEACDFTSLQSIFKKKNAMVFGVSRDSLERHEKFIEKNKLKITLLSDEDGTVCEAYGAWKEKSMYGRKFMGIERTTVVIDEDGKIQAIYPKVKVPGHAKAVLEAL
jgi:peroxiredoxin Q/BCP